MPILDAALAFALTMLVVATVVTQLVNFAATLLNKRSKVLQQMLEEFFTTECHEVVERELNRINKSPYGAHAAITGSTLALVAAPGTAVPWSAANAAKAAQQYIGTMLPAGAGELSNENLIELLKRSSMGKVLLQNLGDEAQAVFDELGKTYEAVGDKFTELYRNHSRWWATGIALALALICNIDSLFISTSYIRNQSLREGVIAQLATITEKQKAQASAVAQPTNGGQAATSPANATNDFAALSWELTNTQAQVQHLMAVGFPIGWNYFPHAKFAHDPAHDFALRNSLGGWVMWILGILLTGVLAGLGAPFWYDTVVGISRIAERSSNAKKDGS